MKRFVLLTDAISGNPVIINKEKIVTVFRTDVDTAGSRVSTTHGQSFEVTEEIELIYKLLESDLSEKHGNETAVSVDSDALGKPISFLGLSGRITYSLEKYCAPPATISDLLKFSASELVALPRIGSAAVKAISTKLKESGFNLRV